MLSRFQMELNSSRILTNHEMQGKGYNSVRNAGTYVRDITDVIGYTDYAFECTEDSLAGLAKASVGKKMIVKVWHGTFVFGRSAGEALFRAFYLDQACAV